MQQKQKPSAAKALTPVVPLATAEENVRLIRQMMHNSNDLQIKEVPRQNGAMTLLFLETLTDNTLIKEQILAPLLHNPGTAIRDLLPAVTINAVDDLNEAITFLLRGFVILLGSGQNQIICIEARSNYTRSVEEPVNEKVVRGAHLGFIENVNINIHILRRLIENRELTVRYFRVGKETKTQVALVYLNNLANPQVVQEMTNRINSIQTDTILGANFIEEYVEDTPFSPFPQMLSTERPDRVSANLLEGRVALLADGAPTALIFPVNFFMFYQSPDDYNGRWLAGSFFRWLHLTSFFIAIALPALYIATVAFRFEVLPGDLIVTIKQSIEKVPYPPLVEALVMELTMELIREAGIRLPSPLGQIIGVVGGIVVGQAVVTANLVSNVMVIVVAITAIASYVIPSNEMGTAVRLLRFPFMFAAATFGLLGIVLGFTILLIHICTLESFGTPYFAPLSTVKIRDFKDTFIRLPMWKLNKRPADAAPQEQLQETISRGWQPDDSRE